MQQIDDVEHTLLAYDKVSHDLGIFMEGVQGWFTRHPALSRGTLPTIHSTKSRLKDRNHLREKLSRKADENKIVNASNLFSSVTDLAGVRVLHLYQDQAKPIHEAILDRVQNKDWVLEEDPKAYTWDPGSVSFFKAMGLEVKFKDSFYTSVHYLVKPRIDSPLCCEIQVRTLFEEIWGEVDHALNYPTPTEIVACREQLRVLTKVVGAGSRLVDSIFRSAV